MKKFFMLALALTMVAGIAVAAYAEVQNVKVSGDITALGISRSLSLTGKKDNATRNDFASITRVKVDADLTDNVATTVRLLNERYWGTENENAGTDANTGVALDLAFVTLKEFLYSPLTLTVGRQELQFGNGMIVGDPDTNNQASAASPFGIANANNRDPDLSARKSFDAIRATLNYDPLVIDAIAAKVTENALNLKDDSDLYGVNAGYKLGGKFNVLLEGYWFERRLGRQASVQTSEPVLTEMVKKVDYTDTFGGRIVVQPVSRITAQLEAAMQRGKRVSANVAEPTVNRKAWGLETAVTLDLNGKVRYAPTLTAMYSYFSGDHMNNVISNNNGAWRGWDPMFENQTSGHITNALFDQSNAHTVGGIVTAQATEDVTLKGEYYAYWWAKAFPDGAVVTTRREPTFVAPTGYVMRERRFAGQEIDLTATYAYTEDVQFALMGGWFVPGPSFNKANNSVNSEVIGSMKVTF